MSDTLRPCPHCGKPAAVIEPASGGRPYVMCTVNYCTGPKDTVGEAIASWNRRAPLDPATLLALPEVQAAIDEARREALEGAAKVADAQEGYDVRHDYPIDFGEAFDIACGRIAAAIRAMKGEER